MRLKGECIMFEIAFNNELLKYVIENFSLQKVSFILTQ